MAPSMPLADFSPNCLSSADQRPERLPGDRQPTVHSTLADGSQFVGDLHSGPGVNPKKATSVAASISSGKAWLPPPQEGRSHRYSGAASFGPLLAPARPQHHQRGRELSLPLIDISARDGTRVGSRKGVAHGRTRRELAGVAQAT